MLRRPLLLLALALAAAPIAGQTFAYNKVEFGNWWISAREDLFPNYLTAGGNVAGDGLFKVFPSELLQRGDDLRITGYSLVVSIDDAYTGAFPVTVEVPAVQFYRTRTLTLGGATYEVPDVTRPVGPRYAPIQVQLPADNSWQFDVQFAPGNTNPDTRSALVVPRSGAAGLALMVLGAVGQRRGATTPGLVLQSTFGERHLAPGRAAYSGSFSAATGAVAMFGTSGMPSATGELYVGLRLDAPTLQLAGPSAGGLSPDPQRFETQLGPGAYATDLASRRVASSVRWLVQAEQFDPRGAAPTHLAFPFLVAVGATGPTTSVAVGGVSLLLDPANLALASVFIDAGLVGQLDRLTAGGPAGFDVDQLGAWASPSVAVPNTPAALGLYLWLQALITTTGLTPVAATNAVRLVLS